MKKIFFILFFVTILFQGAIGSNADNILANPDYLSKLKVKLMVFATERKCHGVQTFYVSQLHISKDELGVITRQVIIYWVGEDMIYSYFGDDKISDSKSNNLKTDVYKTRKEIYGSSYLLTVDEAIEFIQRCKDGNKIVIVMPDKKK